MQKHIITQRVAMNFCLTLNETTELYSYLRRKMREPSIFNATYEELYNRILNKE